MIPERVDVVVIGGGIIGVSIAYHLGKAGITDTLLLERKQLCCGTTWHSVGSVAELRGTRQMTELARYTSELYRSLEAETGQATGYRRTGSVMVVLDKERLMEAERTVALARSFEQEASMISVADIGRLCPQVRVDDALAGLYLPSDGRTNPVDTTQALAKGARQSGVRIMENRPVTGLLVENGKLCGVMTAEGAIRAEIVVLAGGMWSREFAARHGVSLPLQAAEHFYAVTEPIEGLQKSMPFIRLPDESTYYKEDAGKLLFGCLERVAKPWALDGIPPDFCFDSLPEDLDHFEPILTTAIRRFPLLEKAGIQLFFNGPESFTPDCNALIGEAPELPGLFVACGMNTVGVMSGGGVGRLVAQWIRDRRRPKGFAEYDVARFSRFQSGRSYLRDRTIETLGVLYDLGWPNREFASGRGGRRLPLHERHLAAGAVMGNKAGWEVPLVYAPKGAEARLGYSYGRQNWVPWSAAECGGADEGLVLFDLSADAKLEIAGKDAAAALALLAATPSPETLATALWLTERGTIEAAPVILPWAEDRFLLLSPPGSERLHARWIARHARQSDALHVREVTAGYAAFLLAGPKARDILIAAGARGLSAERPTETEIGYAPAILARSAEAGSEAWLILVSSEFAAHLVETLERAAASPLRLGGAYALEARRIDAGRPAWPSELGDTVTPLAAGLAAAVDWEKPDFLGREALLATRAEGRSRSRLVKITMREDRLALYGQEVILRDGKPVGLTTSGCWSHKAKVPVALGYVSDEAGISDAFVETGAFALDLPGGAVTASCELVLAAG